jgi:hypothetical protein
MIPKKNSRFGLRIRRPNGWPLSGLAIFRYADTILAGKLKPHIGVRSLSLGQVSCSGVLGGAIFTYIMVEEHTMLGEFHRDDMKYELQRRLHYLNHLHLARLALS